jgi:DNA-damage-inducible protein J
MAQSTTLQVRIPQSLRDEAEVILDSMGLDLPTAVRLYLKKVIQTRSIPFSLEADPLVEVIEVDKEIQSRMDGIAKVWKQSNKRI